MPRRPGDHSGVRRLAKRTSANKNKGKIATSPKDWPIEVSPWDEEWWLSEEEKAICDHYLGEGRFDRVKAITSTGREYKDNRSATAAANAFFRRPRVNRYLWIRANQIADKVEITQEDILRDMIELKEMAMGRRKRPALLGMNEDGDPVVAVVKAADLSTAHKVLTQLGKFSEIAMWTERHQVDLSRVRFDLNIGVPMLGKTIEGEKVND